MLQKLYVILKGLYFWNDLMSKRPALQTNLCVDESLHPYECAGVPAQCRHCSRAHIEGHDPEECDFCEEDCIRGRVAVYTFAHVHPPEDASSDFIAGWEAAMKFADEHGTGPFCHVKDRGWQGSGRDATGERCIRPYHHPGSSHEGHGNGVVYWPKHESDAV